MAGRYKPFTPRGTRSQHPGQEGAGDSGRCARLAPHSHIFSHERWLSGVSMVTSFSAGILS